MKILKYVFLLMIPLILGFGLKADKLEQLIVFVQGNQGTEQGIFNNKDLVKIMDLAEEMGLEFKLQKVPAGVPYEIKMTPMIVYQNHLGRSVYYGRYTNMTRLRNFIRTSRVNPQEDVPETRENVMSWSLGRADILMSSKITEWKGNLPKQFDPESMAKNSLKAFELGFSLFEKMPSVEVERGDRTFYASIYPYVSQDTVYLTYEVFSQFNCIEPIYRNFDEPVKAAMYEWPKAFATVANLVENQVKNALFNERRGDHAFPVNKNIPGTDWDQIGLSLPTAPPMGTELPKLPELPSKWTKIEPYSEEFPMIMFFFPSPLDNYTGELTSLEGTLNFNEPGSIDGLTAEFTTDVSTITMGDEGLDEDLHNEYLKVSKFPKASFKITGVDPIQSELRFSEPAQATINGEFTMLGITIPVDLNCQMEPIVDDENKLWLLVSAKFSIRLKETFGIDGPEGPSPQNDMVNIYVNFRAGA